MPAAPLTVKNTIVEAPSTSTSTAIAPLGGMGRGKGKRAAVHAATAAVFTAAPTSPTAPAAAVKGSVPPIITEGNAAVECLTTDAAGKPRRRQQQRRRGSALLPLGFTPDGAEDPRVIDLTAD